MPSNNSRAQRDKRQFDAEIRGEERGERSTAEQIAALDARVSPNGARKERTRLSNVVLVSKRLKDEGDAAEAARDTDVPMTRARSRNRKRK